MLNCQSQSTKSPKSPDHISVTSFAVAHTDAEISVKTNYQHSWPGEIIGRYMLIRPSIEYGLVEEDSWHLLTTAGEAISLYLQHSSPFGYRLFSLFANVV